MVTLLSQAPTTPEGHIQYIQFVPLAASMIYSMYDVDNMKLRLQAIKEVAAAGGVVELSKMDIDGLRQLLEGAFKQVRIQPKLLHGAFICCPYVFKGLSICICSL